PRPLFLSPADAPAIHSARPAGLAVQINDAQSTQALRRLGGADRGDEQRSGRREDGGENECDDAALIHAPDIMATKKTNVCGPSEDDAATAPTPWQVPP